MLLCYIIWLYIESVCYINPVVLKEGGTTPWGGRELIQGWGKWNIYFIAVKKSALMFVLINAEIWSRGRATGPNLQKGNAGEKVWKWLHMQRLAVQLHPQWGVESVEKSLWLADHHSASSIFHHNYLIESRKWGNFFFLKRTDAVGARFCLRDNNNIWWQSQTFFQCICHVWCTHMMKVWRQISCCLANVANLRSTWLFHC